MQGNIRNLQLLAGNRPTLARQTQILGFAKDAMNCANASETNGRSLPAAGRLRFAQDDTKCASRAFVPGGEVLQDIARDKPQRLKPGTTLRVRHG
jgi:hypothetical protein